MILQNNIYTFTGKRGSWKTMLASIWWSFSNYKIVYSNFELSYKDKSVINFEDFDLFNKLDESLVKKLIIFDEWWVNQNARNFQSKINKLIWMFTFVSRKYNADFIFITQDFTTIDKMIRGQTDYVIEVEGGLPKYIQYSIYGITWWIIWKLRWTYTIDWLQALDIYKISYNTRDLSGFDNQLKKAIKI